jgi:hypothetical protein
MSGIINPLTIQQAALAINQIYLEFTEKVKQIQDERDKAVFRIFQQAEDVKLMQIRQKLSKK